MLTGGNEITMLWIPFKQGILKYNQHKQYMYNIND